GGGRGGAEGALADAGDVGEHRAAHAPGDRGAGHAAEDLITAEGGGEHQFDGGQHLIDVHQDDEHGEQDVADRDHRHHQLGGAEDALGAGEYGEAEQAGEQDRGEPVRHPEGDVEAVGDVRGLHTGEDESVADQVGDREDDGQPLQLQPVLDVEGGAAP